MCLLPKAPKVTVIQQAAPAPLQDPAAEQTKLDAAAAAKAMQDRIDQRRRARRSSLLLSGAGGVSASPGDVSVPRAIPGVQASGGY